MFYGSLLMPLKYTLLFLQDILELTDPDSLNIVKGICILKCRGISRVTRMHDGNEPAVFLLDGSQE